MISFANSEVVDPTTYETHGLCDGIPLRLHRDTVGEIKGAIRCQRDWSDLVCPVHFYKGTLGEPFSFIQVAIPETLPDRLEICSYANEYAFLYDDTVMEDLDNSLATTDREDMLRIFQEPTLPGKATNDGRRLRGARRIQEQIMSEMMAIDHERSITTMKAWQEYVKTVSSRQRSEPFRTLEEYLPFRISDAGELFWYGLVTFAMRLTIPENELHQCKSLSIYSWSALVLTNDLYSWEKEFQESQKRGENHVMNAIWVLMAEHTISESDAKDLCRHKIRESVGEAIRTVNHVQTDESLSEALVHYLEAILYSISGNLVWSIYCPRYHPDVQYNASTIDMMQKSMHRDWTSHATVTTNY